MMQDVHSLWNITERQFPCKPMGFQRFATMSMFTDAISIFIDGTGPQPASIWIAAGLNHAPKADMQRLTGFVMGRQVVVRVSQRLLAGMTPWLKAVFGAWIGAKGGEGKCAATLGTPLVNSEWPTALHKIPFVGFDRIASFTCGVMACGMRAVMSKRFKWFIDMVLRAGRHGYSPWPEWLGLRYVRRLLPRKQAVRRPVSRTIDSITWTFG